MRVIEVKGEVGYPVHRAVGTVAESSMGTGFETGRQEVCWPGVSLHCWMILPSCAPQACGGSIQTSVNALAADVLGHCQVFEETQIGGER